MLRLTMCLILLLSSGSVLAHPTGHPSDWVATMRHVLTEPDHWLLLLVGGVGVILLGRRLFTNWRIKK